MKEKLRKKLNDDDRNFLWFWKNHIRTLATYSHFMNMLSGSLGVKMTDKVRKIVMDFIKKEKQK